jgi:hypothetical protein
MRHWDLTARRGRANPTTMPPMRCSYDATRLSDNVRQIECWFSHTTHTMTNADNGPDNLVLRFLREIDRKVDRLTEEVRDLKSRVTALEGQFAIVAGQLATMSARLERVEQRLERIERRLEFQDTSSHEP